MFDSLDEQMKKDEDRVSSPKERMMKYALYIAAAAAVFGDELRSVAAAIF
jgi:hypothetical protein